MGIFRRGNHRKRTAIVLRTKDRPLFLCRALESILAQTDQDWCISLVNDGGDRAVLETTLAPFKERLSGRIIVSHFEKCEGRGKGKHINAGINATHSELIAIHDDDDSWEPNFLEKAIHAMGDHIAVVTQSLLIIERLENGRLTELSREIYEPWQEFGISLFRLAESLTFPPIALLFRRSVIEQIGPFDDELGPLEDWEFSLRLFARYEVIFLELPLAHYRQREGQVKSNEANSRVNSARIYAELDFRIRNKLLREDLQRGKMGLGWLVNLSLGHGRLFQEFLAQKNSK